jgi:hypothetical protein
VALTNADSGDLAGLLYWSKPGTNGFSVATDLTGSAYNAPGSGSSILNFSNGSIAFSGGDPGQNFQGQLRLGPGGSVTSLDGLRLKLKFTLSTGSFQGSVIEPATSRLLAFRGAVLQKQNLGTGYFTGANQSGEVVIQP